MAEASRVNLAALQQRDPYITEIVDKALIVALYKFSTEMAKWSLTGIEGSLFVYKRSASPYYGLMVLNRKDLNNLFQPLTPNVEFHLETPFLMYKKAVDDPEDAIWGIWFEDRSECLRLTETIQGVLKEVAGHEGDSNESDSGFYGTVGKLPAVIGGVGSSVGGAIGGSGGAGAGVGGPGGPGGPTGGVKPPPPGMNILSLLSNAQNKYEQEHGASQDQGSDPKPIQHASAGDASGMSQISLDELFRTVNKHQAKAGMRDSSTATSNQRLPKNPPLGRSISVSEVEAQSQESTSSGGPIPQGATGIHVPPNPVTSTPSTSQQQQQPDGRHPLLRLISSKTVEEIERQHREEHQRAKETVPSIPAEAKPAAGKSSRSPGGATDSASVDLMSLLGQTSGESSHPIPIPLSSAAPSVSDLEHSMSSMTLPTLPTLPEAIHGSGDRTRKDSTSSGGGGLGLSGLPMPTFLKPSDLDPSLGPKPAGRTISSNGRNSSKSPSNIPFLTPQAFADLTSSSSSLANKPEPPSPVIIRPTPIQSVTPTASGGLAPLTREQLQQALMHMIQNDQDFVSNVHKAYLASFQTSTGKKL